MMTGGKIDELIADGLFAGVDKMMLVAVTACIIVFLAMIIDLISGLQKARQRGDIRSSWGLKRSLQKFIMYEGGMMIAVGMDLLIHFCKLLQLLRLDVIYGLPVITCLVGLFLLLVEFLSVREKADEKMRNEFHRVGSMAEKVLSKDELIDALRELIKNE